MSRSSRTPSDYEPRPEVWGARTLVPPLGWDRVVLPKLSEAEVPARMAAA